MAAFGPVTVDPNKGISVNTGNSDVDKMVNDQLAPINETFIGTNDGDVDAPPQSSGAQSGNPIFGLVPGYNVNPRNEGDVRANIKMLEDALKNPLLAPFHGEIKAELGRMNALLGEMRAERNGGNTGGTDSTGGSTSTASTYNSGLPEQYQGLVNDISTLDSEIRSLQEALANADTPEDRQLIALDLQFKLQQRLQLFSTVSNLLKSDHETEMAVVNNLRL